MKAERMMATTARWVTMVAMGSVMVGCVAAPGAVAPAALPTAVVVLPVEAQRIIDAATATAAAEGTRAARATEDRRATVEAMEMQLTGTAAAFTATAVEQQARNTSAAATSTQAVRNLEGTRVMHGGTATAIAEDVNGLRAVERAEEERQWATFWRWFWWLTLTISTTTFCLLLLRLGWAWISTRQVRWLALETRSGTALLAWSNGRASAEMLPRVATIGTSEAGAAETLPALSETQPEVDALKNLVLRLLHDAMDYEATNRGWPTNQIPSAKRLGWSSADQWQTAVNALGEAVRTSNAGTFIVEEHGDMVNLFFAVSSGKLALARERSNGAFRSVPGRSGNGQAG